MVVCRPEELSRIKNYTFLDKIKLRGNGSGKVFYGQGIDQIDKKRTLQDLIYVSFEVRPDHLFLRFHHQDTLVYCIEKDEVNEIAFKTRKLKIRTLKKGWVIKEEARITFKLKDSIVDCYTPASRYSETKRFLKKAWLKEKVKYTEDNEPIEIDENPVYIEILASIFS